MSYDAANVHDLTAAFQAADSSGTNAWEPHPWGGVPGIFKQMTVQAGLDYDVSISARDAASLRGGVLNTANSAWNLRSNVASQTWGVAVLQEQSDAALPAGKGRSANFPQFQARANRFERFIHNGSAQPRTETPPYGSLAACTGTGLSATTCSIWRVIPANTHASAATKVYLAETWARPDMVFAHKITTADANSPTGSPIVDTSHAGGDATLYCDSLGAMTADLNASFAAVAAANDKFAGVLPAGDAFQRAVDQGLEKTGDFYDATGVFLPGQAGAAINLWWNDYLHASRYGSCLDALVQFDMITGHDPLSLGAGEISAGDLGIAAGDALVLRGSPARNSASRQRCRRRA